MNKPGPWHAEILDEHRRNPVRVVDDTGNDIAVVACGGDVSRAEAEANARLLAASLELAEACKDMLFAGIVDSSLRAKVWRAVEKSGVPMSP